MKNILLSLALALASFTASAQIILPGGGGLESGISNIVGQIDESTNYFAEKEICIELGGVYVQKTGEGGVLLDVCKWDVGIKGLGLGGQFIDSASEPAAEFGYVAYRKTLGNVAVWGFGGMGYNEIDKKLMGVVGLGLEYRHSKHISVFSKFGYGFEGGEDKKRGMVVGGGAQYNF